MSLLVKLISSWLLLIAHESIETYSFSVSSSSNKKGSISSSSGSSNKKQNKKESSLSTRGIAARSLIIKKGEKYISAIEVGSNNNQGSSSIIRRLELDDKYKNVTEQRDRSFIRLLVTTVEKRVGQIDNVLKELCTSSYPPKKSNKYAGLIQTCLRLGTAEILFLDTPPFAAVSENVEIMKQQQNQQHKVPEPIVKFVNAVLRNVSRKGEAILKEKTSIEDNVSPWLLKQLKADWGEEDTLLILLHFMTEASIDLTLKDVERDGQALLQQFRSWKKDKSEHTSGGNSEHTLGGNSEHTSGGNHNDINLDDSVLLLPNGSLRTIKLGGSILNWPSFKDGLWWVQNASASIPALALIQALQKISHKTNKLHHVVDMCAAPGGKTAQLLSANHIIHKVTAIEPKQKRCELLLDNLKRLNLIDQDNDQDQGNYHNLSLKIMQGQDFFPDDHDNLQCSAISGVLLDVPCTATGTCSHRPDVMTNYHSSKSLHQVITIQQTLLLHTIDNILSKEGGIIVYSTCSLLKQESENQILDVLKLRSGLVDILPFEKGDIPGFDMFINQEYGWMRILPGVTHSDESSTYCDGFFIAKLLVNPSASSTDEKGEVVAELDQIDSYSDVVVDTTDVASEEDHISSPSRDELMSLTVPLLKEKLRETGKPVSGKKEDLIDRLLAT